MKFCLQVIYFGKVKPHFCLFFFIGDQQQLLLLVGRPCIQLWKQNVKMVTLLGQSDCSFWFQWMLDAQWMEGKEEKF